MSSNNSNSWTYSWGTNTQGNDWYSRTDTQGNQAYDYENRNGSSYSRDVDGSTHYQAANGYSRSTSADGQISESFPSSKASDGKGK
ncbi:hypothetical protein CALCODRAFT_517047 [Calocera cornea HHB12733]|uniref:Uncharacterized protein n=1 Tax=Calocera cornea HHB12733 TaxID=1353952 RepID=A0A165GJ50_9BASI|nr:hypothetical protein CALCODRAFT_517047 [Calocera cornea HHB12733]